MSTLSRRLTRISATSRAVERYSLNLQLQSSVPVYFTDIGAPQKIAYLAEEYFRNRGIRDKTSVEFFSGMGKIFAIDKYANELYLHLN
jgi:hypothetical protein